MLCPECSQDMEKMKITKHGDASYQEYQCPMCHKKEFKALGVDFSGI
jgi:transposase-like protein